MKIRFRRITGFRLFRWGRRQLEVWFCPRGEMIPAHWHDHCDSRLTFLGGGMLWEFNGRRKLCGWRQIGLTKKIPKGETHAALVTGRFGLFLNWETWDCDPSSAATDFVYE